MELRIAAIDFARGGTRSHDEAGVGTDCVDNFWDREANTVIFNVLERLGKKLNYEYVNVVRSSNI